MKRKSKYDNIDYLPEMLIKPPDARRSKQNARLEQVFRKLEYSMELQRNLMILQASLICDLERFLEWFASLKVFKGRRG